MRIILFLVKFCVTFSFHKEKLGNVQKNWSKIGIFMIFGSRSALSWGKLDGFSNFLALNTSKFYDQIGSKVKLISQFNFSDSKIEIFEDW